MNITISGNGNIVVSQNPEGLFVNGVKQEIGKEINVRLIIQGDLKGSLEIDSGSLEVAGNVLGSVSSVNADITCIDIKESVKTVNGDISAVTISGNVSSINGDISSEGACHE